MLQNKSLYIVILLIFFTSCHLMDNKITPDHPDSDGNGDAKQRTSLSGGWVLEHYISKTGDTVVVPDEELRDIPGITFVNDTAFGFNDPCNSGSGEYVAFDNGEIEFIDVLSTKKTCPSEVKLNPQGEPVEDTSQNKMLYTHQKWESLFGEVLEKSTRYKIQPNQLRIHTSKGKTFYFLPKEK